MKSFFHRITLFFKKKIYVFGDSHAQVFDYINKNGIIPRVNFIVRFVPGATAQGMVNPNSATDAMNIFNSQLNQISNTKIPIIIVLGEVDVGFVIWYRVQKYKESIEFQMERSLNNYFKFINSIKARGFKNIIVLSASLPTIRDNQNWGEVAQKRKEVKATQWERTALTLEYNCRLKHFCKENRVKFVDFDSDLLDKESSLIKEKFLNNDPKDHHLNNQEYSLLIKQKLFN